MQLSLQQRKLFRGSAFWRQGALSRWARIKGVDIGKESFNGHSIFCIPENKFRVESRGPEGRPFSPNIETFSSFEEAIEEYFKRVNP